MWVNSSVVDQNFKYFLGGYCQSGAISQSMYLSHLLFIKTHAVYMAIELVNTIASLVSSHKNDSRVRVPSPQVSYIVLAL